VSNTIIYDSYEDFDARENKRNNGVSLKFTLRYPNWEEMNKSNLGCWNCTNCYGCIDCIDCTNCKSCVECINCTYCSNCI